ncbi:MAG: glycosyltransferase family 4 protein [Lachnospiraceae bacterium]|nr:glycosyltransferase family 4 protein [Lachnospiraceae bacterium]
MKNISFFSGEITRSGGTERVSSMIANGLSNIADFKICFLSLAEQERTPFFPLNASIAHTALGKKWISPGPGYLGIIPKLHHFLKKEKIDILIDIDIVLDVLSVPAAKGLPVKVISWEHFNYAYETSIFYRRLILKYFTRRTDFIVTLTNQDALAFQKEFHRKKRIHAIYNPMEDIPVAELSMDSEHTEPLPKKAESLPDSQKENALITVGRLIPMKGIDYLAHIAKNLLPAHPDWKWYVIGDGDGKIFLEKIIQKYHLEKQLILTGRIENVAPYLEKSKIYVMTSRTEGLPMCLLEAKTYKLPIVSFDILTGPNEIIEHKKNGYLISAFDYKEMTKKLHKLMVNPTLIEQFSLHAQDNIEKFQMDKILCKWENLLRHL